MQEWVLSALLIPTKKRLIILYSHSSQLIRIFFPLKLAAVSD